MYELKKIGKVFTSKFVGTGPSSYEKKNLPGRGFTKVKKHCFRGIIAVSWKGGGGGGVEKSYENRLYIS